ncbi:MULTISPECIES: Flp pilus assembly protein CpaB [Agrobacterium tumefaciens complex]|jgi:pilus assembly protein CpaB|uniref:Pilus assembly protein cpaB n=1 Tax=Agrobacterium genomosp. 13 str. CFBP 6927 TaxID=1183428 RepID=A0ABM9VCN0_9HYPH|nr:MULTISPECIES: Flp pilus assembly protein CpaB [Agrobacterium tumefaciens complex]TQN56678.1 Flp pilus assembly protein CpaB [Agrobacterium tumefaciens]UXS33072.1 Flp pilus assembly protein CpaB [Agrobacterium tumefaciens]CDN92004.1 Flp pilus assembly protein CpaB [Agrobacterium tumefaciens]CUX17642.1 Putative pilus assembly protein cpaB [Agrobacterium genomosp. 13 str. CFBP 6927]
MKPSRIVILSVALVAAGLAGLVAMQISGTKEVIEKAETIIQKEPTVNVLVSSVNLPVGSRLNDSSMRWTPWPQGNVVDSFITETKSPNAITELTGAVVRLPLFEGEPVRPEKVVDSSTRIMSSLLPAGKRAVATEISVSTGAGGFVLPNDRVDVIMVRKGDNGNFLTENVLNNVRVLAIDQQIKEGEDGISAVVGATATLELTPEQAKIITVAQQMADRLTLALRSIADAQENDTLSADYLLNGGSGQPEIQVIKSGSIVKGNQGASQ